MKRSFVHFVLLLVLCQILLASEARNVILMISDGAGFNTYDSASYYEYGELGSQPYDKFPVRMSCTTFPVDGEYDPQAFWADFEYGKKKATDSAASGTALNTGQKTENGKVSTSPLEKRLVTFAEIADLMGKDTGVVTSVPLSHATPGVVWAHNKSRGNYKEIAEEMILESSFEVIFGAGHPFFDDDGKPRKPDYKYIDKKLFDSLKSGTNRLGWKFIEQKKDFEELAKNPSAGVRKVIGIPQVASTLQQKRKDQLNSNVPDLATMAKAALNVLGQNPNGFYLMIEGGAVDWANHSNKLDRVVEEQVDFNKAIKTVLDWLKDNDKLEETLIIITSDHECGCLWGTEAGSKSKTPFDLPKNNGIGNLPAAKHYSGGHTNALVPLYAQGPGCEEFLWMIKGVDVKAAKTWGYSGNYIDNTDVFTVMLKAVKSKVVIK